MFVGIFDGGCILPAEKYLIEDGGGGDDHDTDDDDLEMFFSDRIPFHQDGISGDSGRRTAWRRPRRRSR